MVISNNMKRLNLNFVIYDMVEFDHELILFEHELHEYKDV